VALSQPVVCLNRLAAARPGVRLLRLAAMQRVERRRVALPPVVVPGQEAPVQGAPQPVALPVWAALAWPAPPERRRAPLPATQPLSIRPRSTKRWTASDLPTFGRARGTPPRLWSRCSSTRSTGSAPAYCVSASTARVASPTSWVTRRSSMAPRSSSTAARCGRRPGRRQPVTRTTTTSTTVAIC
jgi:hypothetical protein